MRVFSAVGAFFADAGAPFRVAFANAEELSRAAGFVVALRRAALFFTGVPGSARVLRGRAADAVMGFERVFPHGRR